MGEHVRSCPGRVRRKEEGIGTCKEPLVSRCLHSAEPTPLGETWGTWPLLILAGIFPALPTADCL